MIRLRMDALALWADREELASEGALAERIGIDRTVLSRIRRGETAPGEKFIAVALAATGLKFEQLFEVGA